MKSTTDRELLELAAKAAGYKVRWHEHWGCYVHTEIQNTTNPPTLSGIRYAWCPLDDSSDAIRLQCDLYLTVKINEVDVEVFDWERCLVSLHYGSKEDLESVVKRAVTIAAAKIGEGME